MKQIAEWRAYEEIEPFGPPAAFYRSAMLAALLFNANRGKSQRPMSPRDYMPPLMFPEEEPSELDQDAVRHAFKDMAALAKNGGGRAKG